MRDIICQHLTWCEHRNLAATYIAVRRCTIARLDRDLGHPLEHVTADDLAAWHEQVALTLTPESRAGLLAHIAGYLRWCVHTGQRPDNPCERIERPRVRRRLPRPIADDPLHRALTGAPARVRPWLHLAAYTGLRACEIASLCAEDIRDDLHPPTLIVRSGKGDKQRVVPLHPTVAALLAQRPPSGPLWHTNDGRRLPPHLVSRHCNDYLHSIGIPETLHQLRHWFGTNVYRISHDLRLTQEQMGHADPATTAGYAAWSPERASGVIGQLGTGDTAA